MDSGLKFWRSILPDAVKGAPSGARPMPDRIDEFTGQLVSNGYAPDEARQIAVTAAKKEDRRQK